MLYAVKLNNKNKSLYEEKVLFFKNKDKAIQFEKDVRFLDDVVYKEDYKKKVEKIKLTYSSFFIENNLDMEVETINQYPILVEFF